MRKAGVCPPNFLSWLPDEQVLAPLILLLSSWLGGRRRARLEQLESPALAGVMPLQCCVMCHGSI